MWTVMARTKMIARMVSDHGQRQMRQQQQLACRWARSGVKNIEGRVQNKT